MALDTDIRGYKVMTVSTKLSAVIVLAMGLDLIPRGRFLVAIALGAIALLLAAFTAIADVRVDGEDPGVIAEMN